MRELIDICRGALILDTSTLVRLKNAGDVFRKGLTILVAVSLLVGLVGFAVDVASELRAPSLAEQRREAQRGFAEAFKYLPPEMVDPKSMRMIREYFEAGLDIGFGIAALSTRLPKPVGGILKALGGFVSAPFRRLSGWMLYTLLVLLAAKLLGGRATVQQMLGCTAFYVLPYLLNIPGALLRLIPCMGPPIASLLGLVAFAWGLVIYVKATAVANELTIGKAIFAVILPVLALIVLVVLVAIVIAVIALIA
ncbi:MAG TPA: hypothetical protein EYP09_12045 [Anaerolineae bacterium]|nr:hypothetical protein [Anaerolineae bacterium]